NRQTQVQEVTALLPDYFPSRFFSPSNQGSSAFSYSPPTHQTGRSFSIGRMIVQPQTADRTRPAVQRLLDAIDRAIAAGHEVEHARPALDGEAERGNPAPCRVLPEEGDRVDD